ncbi:hypothetical protein ONS95_004092 [Cadophora gregata]|uniref:uncharacterized protein n=1 Tax=Cadophora gregata TaxID=51156 RepID=UPI0026DD94D0|nr:uncharacterized protein ONS95_004092 [Cadophora gregata]KAK0105550.1 hypothetical protein ONS96_004935 [Cadophora gregata f. sp. sojae]KAK0105559.1 hypothetical protein ONS95_004092 [Cadophora gregata]
MYSSRERREKHQGQVGHDVSISGAGTFCKVLGLLDNTNVKLLELGKNKEKYAAPKKITLNESSNRTKEESNEIKKEGKTLINGILAVANLAFSTTTISATSGKVFRDRCDLVAVDEAKMSLDFLQL